MERKSLLIVLTLLHLIPFFPMSSYAQNAPVTTAATVGNAVPGQVAVPVTVTDFNNIGAISLTLDYNYTGLHFLSGVPNPQLATFVVGDNNLGNGSHRIIMGWFGSGVTLPNGTAILTLYFTYISGITPLEWYDNGPSCEYADANYNVLNDLPTSSYYFNGYVCGGIGDPGVIQGETSVCQGAMGVSYTIAPVVNATGYSWSLPPGASVATGQNTNSITVDYSLSSTSGNVDVHGTNVCGNGPSSQLPVTVNLIPVANAGIDVTIPYGTSTTLYASNGGTGSFSYHWSPESLLVNPNVQNPLTVNLTSTTTFTLSVTNLSSLCTNSDEVTVFISGGSLTVNPVAIPGSVCQGDSSQLYSNPGGGSGTYTYSWTCIPPGTPPWTSDLANPEVSPGSSTTYNLMVNDGFNTVSGSTLLTVNPLPTATISGGDTLCGEGNSTPLTVDLTGTPPWSFVYSNGLNTYNVTNQQTTPYIIAATLSGIYTILYVQDAGCPGNTFGSAGVSVYPVPPTPVVTQLGSDLRSSSCCGNQWFRDGVQIPGANGQVYTPGVTAHYYDIVTLNGCSSDTSNDVYFVMTGISGVRNGHFRADPNPAREVVYLTSEDGSDNPPGIWLTNMFGQVVRSYRIGVLSSGTPCRLDISGLPGGIYLLQVEDHEGLSVIKILILQ